jgi:hypothetical protein
MLTAGVAGCDSESGEFEGTTSAYLERLGSDTLALEVVRRFEDRIEGEVLARSPVTRYMTYTLEFDETGAVRRMETEHVTPAQNPAGPGRWHAVVTLNGSLASVIRIADDVGPDTVTFQIDDLTIPTIGRIPLPTGILEQGLRATGLVDTGDTVLHVLTPWGASPSSTATAITARGGSEFELDFFGNPMIVSVDGAGRIVGISGARTTMKVEVEPIDLPDLPALAADYAQRDFEGTGLGAPSPQVVVEAGGGGGSFAVRYSRPSMRGRAIWGGLVPYGEVWRTGANAATHFTTDRDVTVGDLELPAGTYTLWSLFTPDGAVLIVNSQTQIWGTAYDASQDLGRTALSSETLDEPVERFTISLDPTEAGATLSLAWDRARYSVPVRVR